MNQYSQVTRDDTEYIAAERDNAEARPIFVRPGSSESEHAAAESLRSAAPRRPSSESEPGAPLGPLTPPSEANARAAGKERSTGNWGPAFRR